MIKYLAFLNNYDQRPCRAQFLWWFYLMLDRIPGTHFLINKDYLKPGPHRWEINHWERIPYGCKKSPKELRVKNYKVLPRIEDYPELKGLKYPSEILKFCLTKRINSLYDTLRTEIKGNGIEAALAWVNNKSLEDACKDENIPVIHSESGPLRAPMFHGTTYFDFSGVNGNTEFDKRFKEFKKISSRVKILSREELLKTIAFDSQIAYILKTIKNKPTYECGVPMQVELDTNLLVFNNSATLTNLIIMVAKKYGKFLVKNHPLASIQYNKISTLGAGDIDTSKNAIEFISNCKRIVTINSSVGFEALLLGKEVEFLGDSPFRNIPNMNENDKLLALNFAVFGYLIPSILLYNEEYYKYRLECSDEEDIYKRGMKEWGKHYGISG